MQKILAIDDNMDNLVTLSSLLKNLMPDCTVIIAQSGLDGIAKAKAELPDTILLDVKMPGMDGFETCRRLTSDESTKHIPVIMITAITTDPQSRIQGLDIGANAFLAKPVDETELISQVKVALRIKKAEDALRQERNSQEETIQERTLALRNEIIERKLAEEALSRSEERYSLTLDAVNDGLWDWNVPSGSAYFSPHYYSMLGYDDGEFPANYASWRLLVHPDDLDRVEEELRLSIENGKGFAIDLRMKLKSGGLRWVSTRGKVVERNAKGQALRMVGTLSDITDRKLAAEELQQRTLELGERIKELNCLYGLSEIFETSGDSLDSLLQAVVELLPPAWQYPSIACAQIKLNRKTFSTANFEQTFWQQQRSILLRSKQIGSVEVCYLEAKPDGDEGPFLHQEGLLLDVIAERLGKTAERINTRQALRESEEKFRALFESAKDGILLLSSHGGIVSLNASFARLHGYTVEEMLAMNLKDLDSKESGQLAPSRLERLFMGEPLSFEVEHYCKNGPS